jgi:hypothetical protein
MAVVLSLLGAISVERIADVLVAGTTTQLFADEFVGRRKAEKRTESGEGALAPCSPVDRV